jgi:hypothetical protein
MTPESAAAWLKALGGRRFLLTVGCGIVDTILLCAGILPSAEYVTLTLATVAVYVGAGTYQKHSEAKNGTSDRTS